MRRRKGKTEYRTGLNGRPDNLETLLQQRAGDLAEVYAAAPPDIAPTGRRGHVPIGLQELRRQVELAHRHGVRYNVLMNGACFGGREFSAAFREKIAGFVGFLDDIGTDAVTVMNPFLLSLVRRLSPRLELVVGSFAEVTEPVRLQRYEQRGADRVVLHQNVYRDFEMLERLRKSTKLPLEIIPNQGCLNHCECFITHVNLVSHASVATVDEVAGFGAYDTPIRNCRLIRQTDPIEFLMSCFIRPEDLRLYEELGFRIFKFAGRNNASTAWMLNVLTAYVSRSYEGNLFDLSSHVGEAPPKLCHLPNKILDGWYESMGSNTDPVRFRRKAVAFCRERGLARYFKARPHALRPV